MTHNYPQDALDTLNNELAQIIDPADNLIADLKTELQGKGEIPTQIGVLAEADAKGLAIIAKADLVRNAYNSLPLRVNDLDEEALTALEDIFGLGEDIELNPIKEAYLQIQRGFRNEVTQTIQVFFNTASRK